MWNCFGITVSDENKPFSAADCVSANDRNTTNLFVHLTKTHKSEWEQCLALWAAVHENDTGSSEEEMLASLFSCVVPVSETDTK